MALISLRDKVPDFEDFPTHENVILGEWQFPPKKPGEGRKVTRFRPVWVRGVEGIAANEVRVDFERTHDYIAFSRLSMAYLERLKHLAEHPLAPEEKLVQTHSEGRRRGLVRKEQAEEAERIRKLHESAISV